MLAAVILAAGGSSRMGQPKQLLRFRGTSLLRRAIDTACAVPSEQVIVVLGRVRQLLPELEATGATVVINDQWMDGVSTSLRAPGRRFFGCARVFIYPADMPLLTTDALRGWRADGAGERSGGGDDGGGWDSGCARCSSRGRCFQR